MEQEFEQEVNSKNNAQKEMGMIIKAINNIYSTCLKQQARRGKQEVEDVTEEDKGDIVQSLIERLEKSKEEIEDLAQIAE